MTDAASSQRRALRMVLLHGTVHEACGPAAGTHGASAGKKTYIAMRRSPITAERRHSLRHFLERHTVP